MRIPHQLLGDWNDENIISKIMTTKISRMHNKFWDRDKNLKYTFVTLQRLVPEFLCDGKNKKVIDISSGSGSALEIMRHYGYSVMGLDVDDTYKSALESQNLKWIKHNCNKFPYPIEDNSYDLLINIGAISLYGPYDIWCDVLNEFARICKGTFFIVVNHPVTKDQSTVLNTWSHPDFKSVNTQKLNEWKWIVT